MIEPAALAKACIVGLFTGNFDMPVRLLRAANAIIEVNSAAELSAAVDRLLRDVPQRTAMAGRAQEVIRNARGSTAAHAQLILKHITV
jgi:3-deoxy-D-manno-octulosonic-acid transferase